MAQPGVNSGAVDAFVMLNGMFATSAEIDTGASMTCLATSEVTQALADGALKPTDRRGFVEVTVADGAKVRRPVWHILTVFVFDTELYGIDVAECGDNLLGRDVLRRFDGLRINWRTGQIIVEEGAQAPPRVRR
jgi:hypothetical protein